AGILALLFIKITADTILARRRLQISLGSGPNNEIASLVSAHSNFSSYVIYFLFLTYLVEQSGIAPGYLIHIIAAAFTLGRLSHYVAFSGKRMNFKLRVLGMQLTIVPMVILALTNILIFIKSM
ncbi:MAG: MAPEG family protein, partial [Bdellovibrionales bacterium]|nr:MAPEG family protein [Bdellovibrionales bacterium]